MPEVVGLRSLKTWDVAVGMVAWGRRQMFSTVNQQVLVRICRYLHISIKHAGNDDIFFFGQSGFSDTSELQGLLGAEEDRAGTDLWL